MSDYGKKIYIDAGFPKKGFKGFPWKTALVQKLIRIRTIYMYIFINFVGPKESDRIKL